MIVTLELHVFQLQPPLQLRPTKTNTNLIRDKIRIADVFLQLEQNLRLDVVFVIVCQTLEEIRVAQ